MDRPDRRRMMRAHNLKVGLIVSRIEALRLTERKRLGWYGDFMSLFVVVGEISRCSGEETLRASKLVTGNSQA